MSGSDSTLSELIVRLADGRSNVALSADCGGVPARSRLNQLINRELIEFPSVEIINGLARGLRVSPETVILACATSLGFRVGQPSRLARLLPPTDDLNDEQVNAVLAVARAMNPGNAS